MAFPRKVGEKFITMRHWLDRNYGRSLGICRYVAWLERELALMDSEGKGCSAGRERSDLPFLSYYILSPERNDNHPSAG